MFSYFSSHDCVENLHVFAGFSTPTVDTVNTDQNRTRTRVHFSASLLQCKACVETSEKNSPCLNKSCAFNGGSWRSVFLLGRFKFSSLLLPIHGFFYAFPHGLNIMKLYWILKYMTIAAALNVFLEFLLSLNIEEIYVTSFPPQSFPHVTSHLSCS